MPSLKVIIVGLGEMGQAIARGVLARGATIMGAVDPAPDKAGVDLGGLLDQPVLGVPVRPTIEAALAGLQADLAILATRSYLKDTFPQIAALVEAHLPVLSTCEELCYPYLSAPELAAEVDRLGMVHGVAVLGTGINPGFLMDALPMVLTTACQEVKSVTVRRTLDASRRRLAFLKKVGAGLPLAEFKRQMKSGQIGGHVGLEQSIALLASALGWRLDSINAGAPLPVESTGTALGLRQEATGTSGGQVRVRLVFEAYAGAQEADSVDIDGVPPIKMTIAPGVHGDLGTVAVMANCIPWLLKAPPGLHTMADLVQAHFAPLNKM
ncbi:MAG: dihydrodipicolinate reductase [Chloroflexi bacterium]|nr:dihydrodipicolinate reductase [Chloroflexota bacterium]